MTAAGKCCRSTPRCRNCPARWLTPRAELLALMAPPDLPAHLVGVPRCLHKYEPLLRPREAQAESAPPS